MKKTLHWSSFVAICLFIFSYAAISEINKKGSIIKTVESKKVEGYAYPPLTEILLPKHSEKQL